MTANTKQLHALDGLRDRSTILSFLEASPTPLILPQPASSLIPRTRSICEIALPAQSVAPLLSTEMIPTSRRSDSLHRPRAGWGNDSPSYHPTKGHWSAAAETCHQTGRFPRPKHSANCFERQHVPRSECGMMRPRYAGVVVAFTLGRLVLREFGCSWPVVVRPGQAGQARWKSKNTEVIFPSCVRDQLTTCD